MEIKNLDDFLSGTSIPDIGAQAQARVKRAKEIFAKTGATEEELDEATKLTAEVKQIGERVAKLQEREDAKKAADAQFKAMKTPASPAPNHAGNGGDPENKSTPRFSSVGSLKHIKVGTRQENEETAYRFFKWFCATGLNPNSQVNIKAIQFCQDNGIELKTLNEDSNEQGGALVPEEFDPMLIRLIERYGVIRQYARISPMSGDTKTQPRRTGGVTAYWTGENKEITASNPTFDNIQLTAKKLAALTVMSSEISEDSAINIADELAFEIGYAFALSEDQAAFNGDGTSAYGGINGILPKLKGLHATIANIAGLYVASGNLFSEFTLADFNNVVGLLPTFGDTPDASWYCHRAFYYGTMQRLELAAGGVTAREVAEGDRRPRPMFLGYPVTFVQVLPKSDANSQIAALLGDLSLTITMGDRRKRTLFTDPYSLSKYDQILVRGTERVDLNAANLGNASATAADRQAGPTVGLISAAS